MICGTLSTGLTEKTSLFFTSSNSSFCGSVRQSSILRSYYFSSISNDNCPASPVTNTNFTNKKCSYSSGGHSFTNCSWNNNGLSSSGGAIHLRCASSQPLISLTVDYCSFFHCHETGEVGGGAIYAEFIGSGTVQNSFFYDCKCGWNTTGPEGAGVLLDYIHTLPLIRCCSFISCTTADDGGGCGIWHSHSSITYAVDSCRFIKCTGTHESNSKGGGIMIYSNSDFITCRNCLFYACETNDQGGGIYITHQSGTSVQPISFSFFRDNQSGEGRDIYLYQFDDTPQPILFSFSYESENGKVSPRSDTWLPQCSMCFVNSNSDGRSDNLGQTKHTCLDVITHTCYIFY